MGLHCWLILHFFLLLLLRSCPFAPFLLVDLFFSTNVYIFIDSDSSFVISLVFIYLFIYLFLREGERESEAGSMPNVEPKAGLDLMTLRP